MFSMKIGDHLGYALFQTGLVSANPPRHVVKPGLWSCSLSGGKVQVSRPGHDPKQTETNNLESRGECTRQPSIRIWVAVSIFVASLCIFLSHRIHVIMVYMLTKWGYIDGIHVTIYSSTVRILWTNYCNMSENCELVEQTCWILWHQILPTK